MGDVVEIVEGEVGCDAIAQGRAAVGRRVADALGRPTLVDAEAATMVVGAPAAARQGALRDRQAPDFTLTDLDGVPKTLAGWTGKKRLLVAFSSW